MAVLQARADGPDGEIRFYTYHLKERQAVRYREGGRLVPEGLKAVERIFRSRDSDSTLAIDPRLLEIIDRIEDHFGVRQVEVISGFRSQAFNRELKATGHTVANESFHTKGMAADLHLDEITEEALRDFALSLQAGGVGFYPSLDMVHVDVGPVRTWGEAGPRKAWIGEKTDVPATLTVTPTRMTGRLRLDGLKVEGTAALEPRLTLEFFREGRWETAGTLETSLTCGTSPAGVRQVSLTEGLAKLGELPYGKYRLKAGVCGQAAFQYSNEVYLKKL